jgi:hypothetical protein
LLCINADPNSYGDTYANSDSATTHTNTNS